MVAVRGYDIEDAIILNQGSIDRGMAPVEVCRSTKVVLKKNTNGQSDN